VGGSSTAFNFISQVPRTPNSTFYPDASLVPRPICRWVRVVKVLGKISTGEMAALVSVYFDSLSRYGNTPRKLSRSWTRDNEEKPIVRVRTGPEGSLDYNTRTEKLQRPRVILEEVRFGVGDVTDSLRDAASLAVGQPFVFGTIPYILSGHRFDTVGSGYWSVTYRFESKVPVRASPNRVVGPNETRIGTPALNWLEEWGIGEHSLYVRSVTEMYGPVRDTTGLPGF
jgi:hypothetical protein